MSTVFLSILLSIPILLYQGYVATQLWSWFVVPTFQVPGLSIPIAIGLCILMNLPTRGFHEKDEGLTLSVSFWIVKITFAWVAGAIVKGFV